jgi:tRNA nucleotidyltransferase (CCA-adding enzyme)
MKVYLVGGAVRDQLLGVPVHERDWVVVGGTPEQLLTQGFQQVGRDFPVFLHPTTREEYALARTERKRGKGYYGFVCDFSRDVGLTQDLSRRDLTINAMAMDDDGEIIDPFNGQADLQQKILRHVSPAFIEDPVRVLRVARFSARFHHLGFQLADETRCLMLEMVKRGELSHLVPERIWQEWARSLQERNPEQFIQVLRSTGALAVVIPELNDLFGIPMSPSICPQVDSGVQALHALMAVAARYNDVYLRFAAVCHTMGNQCTPITSWPARAAPVEAVQLLMRSFCERLRIPHEYAGLARMTAQYYFLLQEFDSLEAERIVKTLELCDAFRRPALLEQVIDIMDASSRAHLRHVKKNWLNMRAICGKITAQLLIQQGLQGEDIKTGLHQRRVEQVELWKNTHEK